MIQINADYALDSDANCWIVKKRTGIDGKTGQPIWEGIAFYQTIDYALIGYLHRRQRTAKYDSFKELIQATQFAKDEILAALKAGGLVVGTNLIGVLEQKPT